MHPESNDVESAYDSNVEKELLEPVKRDAHSQDKIKNVLLSFLSPHSALIILLNILFFSFGLLFPTSSLWAHHQIDCSPRNTATYSPIYDHVHVKWEDRMVNDGFSPIFQQPPSPEVDEAWERIGNVSGVRLTAAELRRMGHDPRNVWTFPDQEDAYWGLPEVYHQTHCIDMMRRAAFPEYYGNLRKLYANLTFPFEAHLLHCQMVLLKAITCASDLDLVTFHKLEGVDGPSPVYRTELAGTRATLRKCKNWNAIRDWKEKNMVIVNDVRRFEQTPPGISEIGPYK